METAASFEARNAPSSYPTEGPICWWDEAELLATDQDWRFERIELEAIREFPLVEPVGTDRQYDGL